MALYAYTARGPDGALIEARMEEESAKRVASRIVESGAVPIRIEETSAPSESAVKLPSFGRVKVSDEDLIYFCRHMHRLSRAGVPIIQAITGLRESTRSEHFAEVLESVVESLRSGHEISSALQRHPKVFPPLFVSMIDVGENTGLLDEAFEQMAIYMELDRNTKRQSASAHCRRRAGGAVQAASKSSPSTSSVQSTRRALRSPTTAGTWRRGSSPKSSAKICWRWASRP